MRPALFTVTRASYSVIAVPFNVTSVSGWMNNGCEGVSRLWTVEGLTEAVRLQWTLAELPPNSMSIGLHTFDVRCAPNLDGLFSTVYMSDRSLSFSSTRKSS